MSNCLLPEQFHGETMRHFKQRKRREWRAVMTAFGTWRSGCAYVHPVYNGTRGKLPTVGHRFMVDEFESLTKDMTNGQSVKVWGR